MIFRIAVELSLVLATLLACMALEAVRPVQRRFARTAVFNVIYASFIVTWSIVLQPFADTGARWLHHRLGVASIPLPEHGWPVIISALVLMVVQDFQFYWVHRAQHSSAILWAMHSFHHSDDDLNVATAYRHYWLEKPGWLTITYVPLGLLFRISAEAAAVYAAVYVFFALFPHMNTRIELGWLSTVVLGPQVHRIHHSADPADFNTNFAGAFPVWDLLFRTYRAPRQGEFPSTGVVSRQSIPTPVNALLWPMLSEDADGPRPLDQSGASRNSGASMDRKSRGITASAV